MSMCHSGGTYKTRIFNTALIPTLILPAIRPGFLSPSNSIDLSGVHPVNPASLHLAEQYCMTCFGTLPREVSRVLHCITQVL